MSTIDIIDFYNGGAQVTKTSGGIDMTHSFGASGTGETEEIGYVPKANSKKVEGPAHDTLEIDGKPHLLLKGGHVYDVAIGKEGAEDIEVHVISAEEGHVSLPLPKGASVDVTEHVPGEEPEEAPEEAEGEPAEEQPSEEPANENEAEGTLGTEEEAAEAPAETEE